jgi:hypothetical protein
MDAEPTLDPNDVVDEPKAAELLEVTVDRIDVLVGQGLLDPLPDQPGRMFRVADVLALRQAGG